MRLSEILYKIVSTGVTASLNVHFRAADVYCFVFEGIVDRVAPSLRLQVSDRAVRRRRPHFLVVAERDLALLSLKEASHQLLPLPNVAADQRHSEDEEENGAQQKDDLGTLVFLVAVLVRFCRVNFVRSFVKFARLSFVINFLNGFHRASAQMVFHCFFQNLARRKSHVRLAEDAFQEVEPLAHVAKTWRDGLGVFRAESPRRSTGLDAQLRDVGHVEHFHGDLSDSGVGLCVLAVPRLLKQVKTGAVALLRKPRQGEKLQVRLQGTSASCTQLITWLSTRQNLQFEEFIGHKKKNAQRKQNEVDYAFSLYIFLH